MAGCLEGVAWAVVFVCGACFGVLSWAYSELTTSERNVASTAMFILAVVGLLTLGGILGWRFL